MKRILLIATLVITGFTVNAQGLKLMAGASFSQGNLEMGGLDVSTSSFTGFHVGASYEVGLSDALFFEPGILFAKKGSITDVLETETRINYIDVPLYLVLKFSAGDALKLLVKAGPVFGYGLSGENETPLGTTDLEFGDDGFKRLDTAVSVGGGIEFKSFQLSANYSIGVSNMSNLDNTDLKSGVFGVTLGYFILR